MGLSLILPEMFLAFAALFLTLYGAWRGGKGTAFLAFLSLAIALGLLFLKPQTGLAFGGLLVADDFGRFVKTIILAASAASLAFAPAPGKETKPEYAILVLFATLGMMLMVAANNLISLYAGLELQNLALYVLTAFRRDDRRASEAGLKYFTLGALSSCVLLFGLSLLYGFAGTVCYPGLAALLESKAALQPSLLAGIAFTVAGLSFKIAAVPFHMWAPDVYEGAPVSVTAFLAAAPKVAALALLARLLTYPLAGAVEIWRPLIEALAVASMLLGGFAGLVQTNLKRLMAYSGIINIGTLLIGLVAFRAGDVGAKGIEGMLLYLAVYVCGVLAVFGVLMALRHKGEAAENLGDFAGLSKTHPGFALALGAALFSLAGIPPFAGFFGKYLVLLAAVKAGLLSLALLGVTASVVAAGYYLRIVKMMYFDAPQGEILEAAPDKSTRIVVVLTSLAVTLFVLIPAPLMDAAQKTAESFLNP